MIFYTSDLHFGHDRVISMDKRPFRNVNEMNKEMTRRWNKKVRQKDSVYILGDFSLSPKQLPLILPHLNGHKFLIKGNHDRMSEENKKLFTDVFDYKIIKDDGKKVIMSHYFMPTYQSAHSGAIMLHGHSHATREAEIEEKVKRMYREEGVPCRAFNVGCMYFDYTPATLDEIIEFWEKG